MILVDTSIWIDHFRASDEELVALLERDMVLSHPFVIGELALGNFQARARAIKLLHLLPGAIPAKSGETLRFIESQSLAGYGIGYIDAHLLASTRLTDGATLWTRDKRLARVATALGLAAPVNGHPINLPYWHVRSERRRRFPPTSGVLRRHGLPDRVAG